MQLNNRYIIGIDGGGTKTQAVIGTSDGEILAVVTGGGSNIKSIPKEKVKVQIGVLLEQLLKKAAIHKAEVNSVFVCTAGGDREEDIVCWNKWIQDFFQSYPCKIQVKNDAVAALVSGTFQVDGLVLVAGTGSIAYLMQDNGRKIHRAGGWGYLFGDEGSGYYMGIQALRYISQLYDLQEGLDEFAVEVLNYLQLKNPVEIITKIYEQDQPRLIVASIAMPILELAERGNDVACRIVFNAINQLIRLLSVLYSREESAKTLPIVVCGGLFENEYFFQQFEQTLSLASSDNVLIKPSVSPVVGAFILALLDMSIPITKKLKVDLLQTWMKVDLK
ncbi:N-acetylglucosamine kinase [Viridibacillus sp. NPDC096237]|uniref:N-acetylglucosamine kinase n=1 Tax=Viridibacillus sp. NPDC096237 TaxID=3390721 RepID=UPI003D00648A